MHLQLVLISRDEPINPAGAEFSKIWVAYACDLECMSLNVLATVWEALIGTHEDVIYELLVLRTVQPSTRSSNIQTTRKLSNATMESFFRHIACARDFGIGWNFTVVE
jgi:hypothetical protein